MEHTQQTTIKLKDQGKKGLLLPNLEKFQAAFSVRSTLSLLTQSYDIIFKELQGFVDFA